MAVLPALMLLTAASLDYTVRWLPFLRRRPLPAIVTMLGVVLAIAPGWIYAANRVTTKGPIPTTQGERDTYLARSLPAYRAHQWLNEQRGHDYRLYGLMDEDMAYFTDGTHIGNTLGVGRFSDILDRTGTGQDLYDALAVFNVDYFLVTSHRKQIELPDDPFFRSHFKLVHQVDEAQIFEVIK